MWCDDLPPNSSWTSLWSGYIKCGKCDGIRTLDGLCPACGAELPQATEQIIRDDQGKEHVLPAAFYCGAETRYEDYVYLQLLEREWSRMGRDPASDGQLPHVTQSSMGASIVLLFWTYFESRIGQLLRDGLRHVPPRFLDDALKRYSFIGVRLTKFYRIAFDSTYANDLESLGYADVAQHLTAVQRQRNAFVHGSPESIDDALAISVVEMLKREHEAWIAVYNLRAARAPS